MTRLARWVLSVGKWLAGELYEGPNTLDGWEAVTDEFLRLYPYATRAEWKNYAVTLAWEAYKAGYLRGYDDSVRIDVGYGPSPEAVADALDPGWRHPSRGIPISDLNVPVPEERDVNRITVEQIKMANVIAAAKKREKL